MIEGERIEEEWVTKNKKKLILSSKKGKYKFYNYPDKEDRLFLIHTRNGERFPIEHDHQIKIMERILKNDILPLTFQRNWNRFNEALKKIKEDRKNEDI